MLALLMGAKGGVGTSSVARHLARETRGLGLDLADGQLAALLERKTWSLAGLAFAASAQRQNAVDRIVKRRITLLWTPECALAQDRAWATVRAVADRATVVVDGGIEPPEGIAELADVAVVVTTGGPVAQYHVERLKRRFPNAGVVALDLAQSRHESRDAARELAAQLFGGT